MFFIEYKSQIMGDDKKLKEQIIGGIIAFIIFTLLSLPFYGVDVPLPSSYVVLFIISNAIFAFVSIFIQRAVCYIYEANVFDECNNSIDYAFKYLAICSSGVNFYVQKLLIRVPFILNKVIAIVFCLFLLWNFMFTILMFD